MRASTWTVSPRGPRAARWERLWLILGAASPVLTRLDELAAAAGPRARGVALVDIEVLGSRPAATLADFRAKCPGLHAVACAAAAAPPETLSAALSAGALDLFEEDSSDEALAARLQSHLRRLFPAAEPLGVLAAGGLRLALLAREVAVRRGRSWRTLEGLSAREFDVLAVLAGAPGRPFGRRELLDSLGSEASLEAVDKTVASLRRKLGKEGRRLKTQRGVGYFLETA